MKTAIVTDSNSNITQKEAKELGIKVVPMPFLIDGKQYLDDVNLSQEEFYEKLRGDVQISTSQPSTYDVGEIWTELLKEYDKIIHIPMSSGLSETCNTLTHFAESEFKDKVYKRGQDGRRDTRLPARHQDAVFHIHHGRHFKVPQKRGQNYSRRGDDRHAFKD